MSRKKRSNTFLRTLVRSLIAFPVIITFVNFRVLHKVNKAIDTPNFQELVGILNLHDESSTDYIHMYMDDDLEQQDDDLERQDDDETEQTQQQQSKAIASKALPTHGASKKKRQEAKDTRTKILCNREISVLDDTLSQQHVDILNLMAEKDLCLSFKQQKKLFTLKDKVFAWIHGQPKVEQKLLYGPPGDNLYGVVLNDKYVFRHIFKNGGTTVNAITNSSHIKYDELEGTPSLITTVRDPIDHFMSGWAECGFRTADPTQYTYFSPENDLSMRVRSWLKFTRNCEKTQPAYRDKSCACSKHSFPQANFLLDPKTRKKEDWHDNSMKALEPNLEMVGDLREIHGMMEMAGLKYDNHTIKIRSSSKNPVKVRNFGWDKNMLGRKLLRKVCEYVILDYYLFDFEPPAGCRDLVEKHMTLIEKERF
eukprot:CAMPEP_0203692404 /NCGR_PEP_ID=MMETSP0091-20130426/4564_1 /ASSEMBLY_ACC=CAM_ASM_001089 /TAXON_ID=426623 /ORGANISM="Chaetoceros affinis, Strain CCMP159" /LENGTH=422 /DNA_ID=CAMNT_0050563205 /DNA_START=46 /DNA_END=1314 /DNA_ORIENTATION=+